MLPGSWLTCHAFPEPRGRRWHKLEDLAGRALEQELAVLLGDLQGHEEFHHEDQGNTSLYISDTSW
jgi:hypothetical protein